MLKGSGVIRDQARRKVFSEEKKSVAIFLILGSCGDFVSGACGIFVKCVHVGSSYRGSVAIHSKLMKLEATRNAHGAAGPQVAAAKPLAGGADMSAAGSARLIEHTASLARGDATEALDVARRLIDQVIVHPRISGDPEGVELIESLQDLLKAAGLAASQARARRRPAAATCVPDGAWCERTSEALPNVAKKADRGDSQRDDKVYLGKGSLAQSQLKTALVYRAAVQQLGQFPERWPRLHFGLAGVSNDACGAGCGGWPSIV